MDDSDLHHICTAVFQVLSCQNAEQWGYFAADLPHTTRRAEPL